MAHRLPNAARSLARARLPACIGLAAILTLGPALPAQAEVENKTARPGQRIFLGGFTHYFATQGCPSTPPSSIELVTPPRRGRVEQRRQSMVIRYGIDGKSLPGECAGVEQDALALYYTARTDFAGLDTVSVIVTFSNGQEVPCTYRITVPAPEPRRAPTVSQAPAPRDGGTGQAAPTARQAPAAREASTLDFLGEAVRGAAPAVSPAPKIAASGTPVPPTQAEPPAPRTLAPSPHLPATPQL